MHTSDLHFGDENLPCNQDSDARLCVCPLRAVQAAVDSWRPDALLIAGDLFDHPRVSDALLEAAWAMLSEMPTQVVISPGNHDALLDASVYHRLVAQPEAETVHVVRTPGGEMLSLLDGSLSIWASPAVQHTPRDRPLGGVPSRPETGKFVVLAHGEYVRDRDDTMALRSASPISLEEIQRTAADYVALGHWAKRAQVADVPVPAWYSGSPLDNASVLAITLSADTEIAPFPIDIPAGCALASTTRSK